MHALPFVLDDQMSTGSWGSNLKSLIFVLVVIVVGIGVLIWWLKR
jgi:hypothetical protein